MVREHVACRRHVQLVCGDGPAAGPFFQIANRDVDFVVNEEELPEERVEGLFAEVFVDGLLQQAFIDPDEIPEPSELGDPEINRLGAIAVEIVSLPSDELRVGLGFCNTF
jgi:hypothetical protein